jgi:hypothetical protein
MTSKGEAFRLSDYETRLRKAITPTSQRYVRTDSRALHVVANVLLAIPHARDDDTCRMHGKAEKHSVVIRRNRQVDWLKTFESVSPKLEELTHGLPQREAVATG